MIENVYRLLISNASETPRTFVVTVDGLPGIHLDGPAELSIPGAESAEVTLRVLVEADAAPKGAQQITLRVADRDAPEVLIAEKTKFGMP